MVRCRQLAKLSFTEFPSVLNAVTLGYVGSSNQLADLDQSCLQKYGLDTASKFTDVSYAFLSVICGYHHAASSMDIYDSF